MRIPPTANQPISAVAAPIGLLKLAPAALLLAFSLVSASSAASRLEGRPRVRETPKPLVVRAFVAYVSEEGELREIITARIAYLYQEYYIAHLRDIHVDFLKRDTDEKDTLDAPEGYLYLKTLEIAPDHPFYDRIGGREANIDYRVDRLTTTVAMPEQPPEVVVRGKTDIDLLGRPRKRVIYRRSDGSLASCMRAYRSTDRARIYGVGDCEWRKPLPKQKAMFVQRGDLFVTDDISITKERLTSVKILGERGPIVTRMEPLESRATRE